MTQALPELIRALTRAVAEQPCDGTRCSAVETLLTRYAHAALLPDALQTPDPEHYARHLVHRDPLGRFSMIAMVWSPGQGTLLHDHGGLWVVECVMRGKVEVRSFDLIEDAPRLDFECVEVVRATVGEAGHLVPPHDQHIIHNAFDEIAVTLHVYGGDLDTCNVFEPRVGGGYESVEMALTVSR